MEASKFKKLEEYASFLGKKGAEEEKNGEYTEAIPTYLKLVDVLLVMSEVSPSYPLWVKCTTNAESYQKKIRIMIAQASRQNEIQQPVRTQ